MTEKQKTLPCNIPSTKVDEIKAKAILKSDDNYMVRYLRNEPTVALARVPARNADGGLLADAPAVRKKVICAGIPFASMIAFVHDHKLLIGWSKRIGDRQLVETQELHSLFRGLLEESKGVSEESEDYKDMFNVFSTRLVNFLAGQSPKEIEISFSKTGGKTAAIIRGLHDTISIKGNAIESEASGPVPHDIARNLGWFIELAERTYGQKAANVAYPENLPAKAEEPESAVAVV